MDEWPTSWLVASIGGLGGITLGLAARLGRFCTLAAIEDAIFAQDYLRLRMWGLAMAIAIVGVWTLSMLGLVDFSQSLYHRLSFNPIVWSIGGLLFGVGMEFCGTCGFGTLARVGGGDLRALFTFLVLAIAAYAAIAGPTALLRIAILNALVMSSDDSIPNTISEMAGPNGTLTSVITWAIALVLFVLCFSSAKFRGSTVHVFGAVAAGLAIASGWWATGWLGADPFDPQPVVSHTYSVPLGQTLIFVMKMSSAALTFGITAVFGVIVGAFIGALVKREFRWEAPDDAHEMRRHIVGALLMGTGGVYAGGCTIGQGLSGASVLAFSAPIVLISVWCGVWLGLTYLMEGTVVGGLKSLFASRQQ